MQNNLREIRKAKGLTITEVAEKLDVQQPALSSWEMGQRMPPVEKIIRLADIYGVSTDYLLGRNTVSVFSPNLIDKASLPILHGQPVFLENLGWALVNSVESKFILLSGETVEFSKVNQIYAHPYTTLPTDKPLSYPDLKPGLEIMLVPISTDITLCEQLSGYYKILDTCAENSVGHKFMLDKYGFSWLAFPKK